MNIEEQSLQSAKKVVLIRCPNGWIAHAEDVRIAEKGFVFESTESLQKQLVRLVGKSGWTIETPITKRDERGHFLPITKPSTEEPS